MCLVGEVFEENNDDICGAVVQNRAKGDKLSIWTADSKNDNSIRMIGLVNYKRHSLLCTCVS